MKKTLAQLRDITPEEVKAKHKLVFAQYLREVQQAKTMPETSQSDKLVKQLAISQAEEKKKTLIREIDLEYCPSADIVRVTKVLARVEPTIAKVLTSPKLAEANINKNISAFLQFTKNNFPQEAVELELITAQANRIIKRANLTANGQLRNAAEEVLAILAKLL